MIFSFRFPQCSSVSDRRLCCLVHQTESITCSQSTRSSALDTCGDILPSTALKVVAWILMISALVGNGIVISARLIDKKLRTNSVQNLLIISLGFADCLMGVYMLVIASADIHYGKDYYLSAHEWRSSVLCEFAGFLGFVSSESSVFTLTIIALDRLICIKYPFGKYRFTYKMARIVIISVWVFTALLSIILLLIMQSNPSIYGLSDVCIGLPLHVEKGLTGRLVTTIVEVKEKTEISSVELIEIEILKPPIYTTKFVPSTNDAVTPWWFSIVMFIGVNFMSFCFIVLCYVLIFVEMRRSSASFANMVSRKRELKAARRMAYIIGTDFATWIPVFIMGIASQSRLADIDPSVYAWTAILIIPINSSLNPFLYTFLVYYDDVKKTSAARSPAQVETSNRNLNQLDLSETCDKGEEIAASDNIRPNDDHENMRCQALEGPQWKETSL